MPTNTRDPRSLITPDAFQVSDDLLGTPLARPGQRATAILIDLFVISLLTAFTSDFRVLIWGVVGFFFVQLAFRDPGEKMGRAAAALFRGATGCLGIVILFGVGIALLAIQFGDDAVEGWTEDAAGSAVESVPLGAGDLAELQELDLSGVPGIPASDASEPSDTATGAGTTLDWRTGLRALVTGLGVVDRLSQEDDPEAAQGLIWGALDAADESGLAPSALREVAQGLVTEEAEYTDDPDAFAEAAFESWARERGVPLEASGPDRAAAGPEIGEVEAEIADLTDAQLLREWAARIENGDTLAADPRAAVVRARATEFLANDTLRVLERERARLATRLESARGDLSAAEAALAEGQNGFTALLRDIWEQLGSAFGLWSIYFTVMLTLFRGRTVGKLLTRTRVVRLDGEPMGWWAAFERSGGYFAGIATGLLGFAQVYWDSNRQCVHDKISGTAVIRTSQPRDAEAWKRAAGVVPTSSPDPNPPR